MLMKRINRSDPEKLFIVVKSVYSTASLTTGQAVNWDLTQADGVSVTKPAAGTGINFAGIVVQSIADEAYGMIQVYGYNSSVRVLPSVVAAAAGTPLDLPAANFALRTMITATTTGVVVTFPVGFSLEAYTLSGTTAAIACFIKAL